MTGDSALLIKSIFSISPVVHTMYHLDGAQTYSHLTVSVVVLFCCYGEKTF